MINALALEESDILTDRAGEGEGEVNGLNEERTPMILPTASSSLSTASSDEEDDEDASTFLSQSIAGLSPRRRRLTSTTTIKPSRLSIPLSISTKPTEGIERRDGMTSSLHALFRPIEIRRRGEEGEEVDDVIEEDIFQKEGIDRFIISDKGIMEGGDFSKDKGKGRDRELELETTRGRKLKLIEKLEEIFGLEISGDETLIAG